ncbi:MAG TPA: fatty acid oxidation complex subunit alpha FadJ [Gemmatimonadaceae bacterium]
MTTTAAAKPTTPYALTTEVHDGIAVVTFDLPNESVNKLDATVAREFGEMLDQLERDESIRGAVLISGKADTFIAGADINEFLKFTSPTVAERMSREGQLMFDRLETLRVPVVAAIHGACLGGGLEIALACRYRIVTDHPKTVLALPEVQLGVIPGFGGTQRLPRLVGLRNALDMILTGKNTRAKKAWQMGLADELVHPAILRDVAVRRARELADGTRKRASRKSGGAAGALLEDNPAGRAIVFSQARKETLKKTKGHYPAPLAALRAVEYGYRFDRDRGLEEEARLFGEMAVTDVSKQLVFLFFATTSLKKDPGVDAPAPEPAPIDKIGILGAGFMGAGIASVAVQQGTVVRLKDAQHERVGKGLAAVREVVKERLTRKQITRQQFDDMLTLVGGTIDYSGFGNADLVIEAVFEDLAVKHAVLREVEQVVPDRTIFASNTSTIPITRIAQASARPENVIGMHFFSPVHKMPLLEVIVTPATSKETTVTTIAYGRKLGKTVIVVNDGPGFYANRILSPYINEAGKLLDQGAPIESIDRALANFGFPVGPITLVDEVGIDVAGKAGAIMAEAFGERMAPSASLQKVVEAGRTGRKGKKGFYQYDEKGKKGKVDESIYDLLPTGRQRSPMDDEEIVRRTVLAMVNEAARTLEDGIIRTPRDGDIGAVFGIGFPPFRGGPFRYMDSRGIESIVRDLEELNDRFPPRFQPAQILLDMARKKERFYPEGRIV